VLAAQLGQVAPGRHAHLRRQVLDEHRDEIRREDHPEQQVAELRSAADVRREVAGIDVGDRRDERRSQQRQPARRADTSRGTDCVRRLIFDGGRNSFSHD
jgi:hypothetical protein